MLSELFSIIGRKGFRTGEFELMVWSLEMNGFEEVDVDEGEDGIAANGTIFQIIPSVFQINSIFLPLGK